MKVLKQGTKTAVCHTYLSKEQFGFANHSWAVFSIKKLDKKTHIDSFPIKVCKVFFSETMR